VLNSVRRWRSLVLQFRRAVKYGNIGVFRGLFAAGCMKLKSIHGLFQLKKLRFLNVRACTELEELEDVEQCTWLEKIDASICCKLQCPVWE